MDPQRHKTLKKPASGATTDISPAPVPDERFRTLLEAGAREAYSRPWHRIERGLRLNRLRIFVEEIAPQYDMNKEEREDLFLFLQKALDRKLLNTLKVVQYDPHAQRIVSIKGLELKRNAEGLMKGVFNPKKSRTDTTRKKKKEDMPCVSTDLRAAGLSTATAQDDDNDEVKIDAPSSM